MDEQLNRGQYFPLKYFRRANILSFNTLIFLLSLSAGVASHSVDWRKSAGGFIHGYRYTGNRSCKESLLQSDDDIKSGVLSPRFFNAHGFLPRRNTFKLNLKPENTFLFNEPKTSRNLVWNPS